MPSLSIDIKARLAEFQDGINRVERDTSRMVKGVEGAFNGLRSAASSVAGILAVGSVISTLRSTADSLDALGKSAQGVGVTVEALSSLRFAYELSGLAAEQADKSLAVLSKRLSDAAKGSGEAAEAFSKLGIDPKQFTSADEALKAIADKFALLPDGVQKTTLAAQVFGEELGAKMVPLLNAGAQGIRDMQTESDILGRTFSQELANDAAKFNDELTRFNAQIEGLKASVAGPVLGEIANFLEIFRVNQAQAGGGIVGSLQALNQTVSDTNPVTDFAAQVRALQQDIDDAESASEKLRQQLSRPQPSRATAALQADLERLQTVINDTQSKIADINNKSLLNFPGIAPVGAAAATSAGGPSSSGEAKKITEGERLLQQLQRRLDTLNSLTEVEQLQLDIARRRVSLSGSEESKALALAAEIDARKDLTKALEAEAEMQRLIDSAKERSVERDARVQEALQRDAEALKDLADPSRELFREIERIQTLLAAGLISQDVADKNIQRLTEVKGAIGTVGVETEKVESAFGKLQFSFESGFEKAIFAGEKLSDVFNQLILDMAKLIVRQQILTPLFNTLLGAFSGTGPAKTTALPGVGTADAFASLFLTSAAPQKSSGGVTVNVAPGMSQSMTEMAVAQGMKAAESNILNSRVRGGAYADR